MEKRILELLRNSFLVIVFILLFISLAFVVAKDEKQKDGLYRVYFNDHSSWTENVIQVDENTIEFIDIDNKRKYVVRGSYAIINPKITKTN